MKCSGLHACASALLVVLAICLCPLSARAAHRRLSTPVQYHKYVDPLLAETDFGIHYYEGGGGDESVLYPLRNGNPYAKPSEPVLAIVRAGVRAFPALIDCLSDGRMTTVPFDGNNITRKMDVPVGFVCLDILMHVAHGPGIEANDGADGLGGSINTDFYFRPNDYANCLPWPKMTRCDLEPWILVVQSNWSRLFRRGELRFHNPYDDWHIPEYAPYTSSALSPKK